MQFYDKIDSLLALNGVSRKKMCESIDLSYNTFNSMLRRKSTNITLDVIESIADFFDVAADYLIRDEITDPNYGKESATNNIPPEKRRIFHIGDDTDGEVVQYPQEAIPEVEMFLNILNNGSPEAVSELKTVLDYINYKYGIRKERE